MTAEASAASSPAGRKIRRLGIAVVIAVALYSAGWFYVARKFQDFLGQFVNRESPGKVSFTCANLSTGGALYLFRFGIGFTCEQTGVTDPISGAEVKAGPVQAMARVYNPGFVNVELAGPATATLEDGTTVTASWKKLGSSLHAGLSGLQELSLQGDLPSLKIDSPAFVGPFDLKVKEGEFHTRQNNGDLDLAVIANDFEWLDKDGAAIVPKLSTSADLTVYGKAAALQGKPIRNPMKGEIRAFKIATPDGLYGELSGPFTVDEKGYINGTFRTRFEKIDLWDQKLRALFPDAQDTIGAVAALLKGLAKGGDTVTVNLKVERGDISLSFIPLGKLPRI